MNPPMNAFISLPGIGIRPAIDGRYGGVRESLDREWEDSVKMALIARDLMVGNPRLKELGYLEQGEGHGAFLSVPAFGNLP